MSRRALSLVIPLALLLAVLPLVPPAGAGAPCTLAGDVGAAPPLTFAAPACTSVHVTGDVHVLAGGSLAINGVPATFAGPFRLDVDGGLTLSGGASLASDPAAAMMAPGDLRLSGNPPLAAGTVAVAGDADVGQPLAPVAAAAHPFAAICYVDANNNGQRDPAELVLLAPACGAVHVGNLRLSADSQGHPGGARMAVGDADVGKADAALPNAAFMFSDPSAAYAAGDPLYLHFDPTHLTVQAGDIPLTGSDAFLPVAAGRTDRLGQALQQAPAQIADVACVDADRSGDCGPTEAFALPLVAGPAPFRVTLEPDATGSLQGAVTGAQAVVLRSPAIAVSHLALAKSPACLQVEGAAAWPPLTFDALSFSSCAVGLAAVGPGTIRLPDPTFTDTAVPFQLTPSPAGDAPTVLTGPFPGTPKLAGTARLGDLATLSVTVNSAPGPATVRAIDRDGAVQATGTAPDGTTPATLSVPYQFRTAFGTVAATPYRFAASIGSDATSTDVSFSADQALALTLTGDADNDAPVWGTSTLTAPAASNVAQVQLSWGSASDDPQGLHTNRAIARYELLVDGVVVGTALQSTAFTTPMLAEGQHAIAVRAVDLAGNTSPLLAQGVLVDLTPPTLVGTLVGITPTLAGFYNTPFKLNLTAVDTQGGSGLASLTARVNGGLDLLVTKDLNFTEDGDYTIVARAVDKAGNVQVATFHAVLDRQPPVLQARLAVDPGVGAWSSRPVTLLANATDALSGVARLRYRVDGGDWQPASASGSQVLNLTAGQHLVTVEATDGAGNSGRVSIAAAFDPNAPGIALAAPAADGRNGWLLHSADVTATVTPAASPLGDTRFRVDGGPWGILAGPIHLLASGDHLVEVSATDAAGNTGSASLHVPIALEDPVPPQVAWSSPAAGSLRADWAKGPAFDAPSGLARVAIEEKSSEQSSAGPRTLVEAAVAATATDATATGLAPGTHQVRVRVEDQAGRSAATEWTNVTVVSDGAGSSIVLPRSASGTQDLLPGNVAGLREVRYYVDGLLVASIGQPPFAYSWDTRGVHDGPHTVDIVATAQDGRLVTQSVAYTIRNGYASQVADNWLPFAAAVALSGLAAGLGLALRQRVRRAA